jgi:NAD(P)H-dependent FMN reductase
MIGDCRLRDYSEIADWPGNLEAGDLFGFSTREQAGMTGTPRLGVVLVSVREGRVGAAVAAWALERATEHAGFGVELVDLKAIDLPLLREPNHPRLRAYTEPKTHAWSATVDALDAFVFVTPEYNYSTPPSLANALDHLYVEWTCKPAAFVSYGGISGGLRGVQMTKQRLVAFNMMPIVESVTIPFVAKQVQDGRFAATDSQVRAAGIMLDELRRWSVALATLRPRG